MKQFRVYWQTCVFATLLVAPVVSSANNVPPTETVEARSSVIAGRSNPATTLTAANMAAVQAVFVVSPTSGIAGQTTFAFTDQSTGSITARAWQFGDGSTSSAVNPTHVYSAAGTYDVMLTVSGDGSQSSAVNQVTVTALPVALVANFTFNPANPTTQQNVTFIDQSTGGVTSWSWDFGDGSTSQQRNAVKNYPVAGVYPVSLTVYRNSEVAAVSKLITVASGAPAIPAVSAAFEFEPAAPKSGEGVNFADRSTGSPLQWAWSFGDGSTSNVQNPVHAFATEGVYTVALTVANSISSSTTTQVVDVAPSVQTYRSLVSVAAQTNGVAGSVWRTELTIFNAGTEAANVRLIFIPGAAGALENRSLVLSPKQTVMYVNALPDIFGMVSGAGALAIEATSPTSTPNLKVSSRTFTDGAAGTYGQSVPEVSDLNQTLYLTGLASNASFRTNLGFVNRTSTTVTAILTLVDGTGVLAGYTGVSVPANSFQQAPLSTYFGTVAGHSYDTLSLTVLSSAANSVSVYASVVDNRTQDPVYIQGIAGMAGSSMIIPAVGRTAGINGTFWRSDVTIYNPSRILMSVGLRYFATGADNRSASVSTAAVEPGQTIVLADVVGNLGIQSGSGALELTWSTAAAPIVTSRTYTTAADGGTYGQSIDPVARFSRDQYVPGLRSDANFRTNVGFVNNGDVAASINVSLLSASGQTIATALVALAPKSQQQSSLAALFPKIDPTSLGSFTLQAHTDTAPTIFVYGSIVDNTSGDPVFFAGE